MNRSFRYLPLYYPLVALLLALIVVAPFLYPGDAFSAGGDGTQQGSPSVGVRTGVYQNGQAALWDLNVIDHFHYFGPEERARGYQPEQPIKFSHKIHVGDLKVECQYCHWSVSKAAYAAIPEVETCYTCHKMVKGKDEAAQSEIKKILSAYSEAKAIEWVKVHVMPDYVKFNHKRHVKGGVACQECHGQISEMEVVERVSSMKMGWCVECHRERGASIDCMTCHH
jgi:hypothetical protein